MSINGEVGSVEQQVGTAEAESSQNTPEPTSGSVAGGSGQNSPDEARSEQTAVGADTGGGQSAGDATGTQQAEWTSIRDYAKSALGLDASQYQDDASFVRHLAQQAQRAQQLEQLAQYGQQYVQHAAQFQQYLAQQQQAAQQPKEQAKPWWNPPEWRPEWNSLLARDAQGNVSVVPNADPSLLQKYHEHQQYVRNFATQLFEDPGKALKPLLDEYRQSIHGEAEKIAEQKLAQHRDQLWADEFVRQNSHWLYQHDASGGVVRDALGRPVGTPAGRRFAEHLNVAAQAGIQSQQAQEQYARQMIELDVLREQSRQQQQLLTGQQQKQQVLNQANRHTSNTPGPMGGNQPPRQNGNLSFRDWMAKRLEEQGHQIDSPVT